MQPVISPRLSSAPGVAAEVVQRVHLAVAAVQQDLPALHGDARWWRRPAGPPRQSRVPTGWARLIVATRLTITARPCTRCPPT